MTKQAKFPRKQSNFRLDAPTQVAIRILSEKLRRSQGQIIELAVEDYFVKVIGPEAELVEEKNDR